jgi:hypothetical protein
MQRGPHVEIIALAFTKVEEMPCREARASLALKFLFRRTIRSGHQALRSFCARNCAFADRSQKNFQGSVPGEAGRVPCRAVTESLVAPNAAHGTKRGPINCKATREMDQLCCDAAELVKV